MLNLASHRFVETTIVAEASVGQPVHLSSVEITNVHSQAIIYTRAYCFQKVNWLWLVC